MVLSLVYMDWVRRDLPAPSEGFLVCWGTEAASFSATVPPLQWRCELLHSSSLLAMLTSYIGGTPLWGCFADTQQCFCWGCLELPCASLPLGAVIFPTEVPLPVWPCHELPCSGMLHAPRPTAVLPSGLAAESLGAPCGGATLQVGGVGGRSCGLSCSSAKVVQ